MDRNGNDGRVIYNPVCDSFNEFFRQLGLVETDSLNKHVLGTI